MGNIVGVLYVFLNTKPLLYLILSSCTRHHPPYRDVRRRVPGNAELRTWAEDTEYVVVRER